MTFIRPTLEDGRHVLIRADLIQQVRQRETGAEIWLPTVVVAVVDTVDQIQAMLEGLMTTRTPG